MTALRRPVHPRRIPRPHKVQAQLAHDEYCLLEDAAREQGLALGAFLRQAALAFTVAERARRGELDALDRRLSGAA